MSTDDRFPLDRPADEDGGRSSGISGESAPDPDSPPDPDAEPRMPLWQEGFVVMGVALVVAMVVKALVAQMFLIPSASMEPGLVTGDRILVEKVSTWSGTPHRGDVVVFKDPGGWLPREHPNAVQRVLGTFGLLPEGGHLVKRVVGTAGDTIVCCDEQGRISVNGIPIDEEGYVSMGPGAACNGPMIGCVWTAGPVPDGHMFVMGDHRDDSGDSTTRLCRPDVTDCDDGAAYVDTDLVVGRSIARVWPFGRWAGIRNPQTFTEVPDPIRPSPSR